MRLITSAAIPSASALPSATWTVGEHVNSGKKHVNPLQQDAELRRMLAALQTMESRKDFGRWKTSFLQRFETHLCLNGEGEDGTNNKGSSISSSKSMQAASLEYQRFGQAVVSLVMHVHKVEAILAQGDLGSGTSSGQCQNTDDDSDDDDDDQHENGDGIDAPIATAATATSSSPTVKARQCMVEFGKKLTVVMTLLGQLIPGTVEREAIVGYTKFHMGAVLVKNGFSEYGSLTWCRNIFNHMRNVSLVGANGHDELCPDLQILERLTNYSAAVDRFCDVMADLGLHDAMLKCEALFGDYSDSSCSSDSDNENGNHRRKNSASAPRSPRRHRSKYLSPPDSPVRKLVETRPPTAAEVLESFKKDKESGQLVTTSSVVQTKSRGDWEWKLNGPPLSKNSNHQAINNEEKSKVKMKVTTTTTTTTTTKVTSSDHKMKQVQQTVVKKAPCPSGKQVIAEEKTVSKSHVTDEPIPHDDDGNDDDEKEAAVDIVVEEKLDCHESAADETPAKEEKKVIGSLVGRWKLSASSSNFVPNPEQWKAPTFKGHVANRYVPVVRGGGPTTRTFNRRASLDSAGAVSAIGQSSITGDGGGGGEVHVIAPLQHSCPTAVSRGPRFNRRASLDCTPSSQSPTTEDNGGEGVAQSTKLPPTRIRSSFSRRASLDNSQPFTTPSCPEPSTAPEPEMNAKDSIVSGNESQLLIESNNATEQQAGECDNRVTTKPPIGVRGSVANRYQPWAKSSNEQQPVVKRTSFNRRASLDSNLSITPTTPSSLNTTTKITDESIDERPSVPLLPAQLNKTTQLKYENKSDEAQPSLTRIAGRTAHTIHDRINKHPSQTPYTRPSYRRASIDSSRSTLSWSETQPQAETGHHLATMQSAENDDCSTKELQRGSQDEDAISVSTSSESDEQQQPQHQKGAKDSDTGEAAAQKTIDKVTVGLEDDAQTGTSCKVKIAQTGKIKGIAYSDMNKSDDADDAASCSSSSSSSSSSANNSDIDSSLQRRSVKREKSLQIGKGIEPRPFAGNNNKATEGKTWSKNKSDGEKPKHSPTDEEESSSSSSDDDSPRHNRGKSTFTKEDQPSKEKQRKPNDIKNESDSESSNSTTSEHGNDNSCTRVNSLDGKRRVQKPEEEDSDDESGSESDNGPCYGIRPMTLSLRPGAVETPAKKGPSFNRRGSLDSSQPSMARKSKTPDVEQPQQPAKRSSLNRRGSLDSSTISTPPTLEVKKEEKDHKEIKGKKEKKLKKEKKDDKSKKEKKDDKKSKKEKKDDEQSKKDKKNDEKPKKDKKDDEKSKKDKKDDKKPKMDKKDDKKPKKDKKDKSKAKLHVDESTGEKKVKPEKKEKKSKKKEKDVDVS